MFDLTTGFAGNTLGGITVDDAAARVIAYCTTPDSGWGVYDLARATLQRTSTFDTVTPWSLLWANLLNGNVTLSNVARFTPDRVAEFASLLADIPVDTGLGALNARGRTAVSELCSYGWPGVWCPKITKIAALYRPHAVPVLDGYIAMAFGFTSEGFSVAVTDQGLNRRERIAAVVTALATFLRERGETLGQLRERVEPAVPEVGLISDLRLLDIVLWTSQADRRERRRADGTVVRERNYWRNKERGVPIDAAAFDAVRATKTP